MRIAEHVVTWQKSSYSDNDNNCVEIALGPAEVGVRDTKDRDSGQLAVNGSAWRALLAAITH